MKKTPAAQPAEGQVKARVLFAGAFGRVDAVVIVDADTAAAGLAAGELDPDPGAVAYAEQLAGAAAE